MESYLAAFRFNPEFMRPHVLVIYREGCPDCLLVGRLEQARLDLKVGYTTLFNPNALRLFFVRGGFLGNRSSENCRLIIRELKRSLQLREAEAVELNGLGRESEVRKAAKVEFSFPRRGHCAPFYEHHWAQLPSTYEEFLGRLPRKNRHEFRRHQRRALDHFSENLRIVCYRREQDVEELVHQVEKVCAKTYQRTLGVGFLPRAETLDTLQRSARRGSLRAYVLYIDDQPRAFFIGHQLKRTFHGQYMGFDPEFAGFSPGLLVLLRAIEDSFDSKMQIDRFDLGWGDREYKRVICDQSQTDGPMYLYAPSWAGLILNVLRSGTSFIDLAATSLLRRSASLRRWKRAWLRRKNDRQIRKAEKAVNSSVERGAVPER